MNATKTNKPRKPKSPAVPSWDLKAAFEDTKKLYNTYTHSTFSKSEYASVLKISATSGPTSARIFTMKEYGLIEGTNDSFRVSQRFMDMKDEPQTSAVFKRGAMDAIRGSAIFAGLLDEWKTKLPPRDAVAKRLEQKMQFNPDRAKEVAAVLEESLRFAGVLDQSGNILPIRDEPNAGGAGERHDGDRHDDNSDGHHRDEVDLGDVNNASHLRTEIPLGDGRRVVVSYPNDLTEKEATKVGNVLAAIVS
jgi:hypothetical protein